MLELMQMEVAAVNFNLDGNQPNNLTPIRLITVYMSIGVAICNECTNIVITFYTAQVQEMVTPLTWIRRAMDYQLLTRNYRPMPVNGIVTKSKGAFNMAETIGLDIGSHSIKLVGLKMTSKGPFLTHLGMKEIPPGTDKEDVNTISEILKALLKEVGLKTKKVNLTVSGSGSSYQANLYSFPSQG